MSKYLLTGLTTMSGKSKTGNDYTMHSASVMSPIESTNAGSATITGIGYTTVTIPVSQNFFPTLRKEYQDKLAKNPAGYPPIVLVDLDVTIGMRDRVAVANISGFGQ